MKNSEFMKLLGTAVACAALVIGYMLLPDTQDLKERVGKEKTAAFLSGFSRVEKPEKGSYLPEVSILSRENRPVELKAITRGKITVVNFWASWCAPCLEELPSLAQFQLLNPDVLILPISLDFNKKLPDLARLFEKDEVKDLRWFYDHTGALRKSLNLSAYPATYILDREGRIIYILQGPNKWGSPEASMFIRYLSQDRS